MFNGLVHASSLVAAGLAAVLSVSALAGSGAHVHLYTLSNDTQANSVLAFEAQSDGMLKPLDGSPFFTGGMGLGGGDPDQQGAVRIKDDFLLTVNPGSDSIAVFRIAGDGALSAVKGSPFASGGSHPMSLAMHGDLVYVANQAAPWGNPKTAPNITGFRMNKDGALMPIAGSTISFADGYGPAQVEFSPAGGVLVVSAGFQDGAASALHAFQVMMDGKLKAAPGSPARPMSPAGLVGFSFSRDGQQIFASDFRGSSVSVFDIDKSTGGIKLAGEPTLTGQTAACWTDLSTDGQTLYVVNFVSNSVTAFDASGGTLKLLGSAGRRDSSGPDLKDVLVAPDGRHVYALGSVTRNLYIFKVNDDRSLAELPDGQSPIRLEAGQNLLGLGIHVGK